MQSDTELGPGHICVNPIYECLTDECTLSKSSKFLCKQCFDYRHENHYQHSIIQIQADITYHNDDKRMKELYNKKLKTQEANQIQMPTHILLTDPSRSTTCFVVSQDRQIVACTKYPGREIYVYYLKKPTEMRRYWDERIDILQIVISPNNEYLVGYGYGTNLLLWNLKKIHSTAKYLQNDFTICKLQFSCDSKQMFTFDYTYKVWDCKSGDVIHDIPIPQVWDFTTSKNFIYTSMFMNKAPYNSTINQLMKSNRKHVKIVCILNGFIKLESANNEFIIATQQQNFKIIHVRTGKLIRTISNFQGNIQIVDCDGTVGYSLQSHQFATKTDKHRVTQFCLSSLQEIKSWETSKQIERIHLQEDGKCIYIVDQYEILRYE